MRQYPKLYSKDDEDFNKLVKDMTKLFKDEKLRDYWLRQFHEWSKEQLEIIKKEEEKCM